MLGQPWPGCARGSRAPTHGCDGRGHNRTRLCRTTPRLTDLSTPTSRLCCAAAQAAAQWPSRSIRSGRRLLHWRHMLCSCIRLSATTDRNEVSDLYWGVGGQSRAVCAVPIYAHELTMRCRAGGRRFAPRSARGVPPKLAPEPRRPSLAVAAACATSASAAAASRFQSAASARAAASSRRAASPASRASHSARDTRSSAAASRTCAARGRARGRCGAARHGARLASATSCTQGRGDPAVARLSSAARGGRSALPC